MYLLQSDVQSDLFDVNHVVPFLVLKLQPYCFCVKNHFVYFGIIVLIAAVLHS